MTPLSSYSADPGRFLKDDQSEVFLGRVKKLMSTEAKFFDSVKEHTAAAQPEVLDICSPVQVHCPLPAILLSTRKLAQLGCVKRLSCSLIWPMGDPGGSQRR